MPGRSKKLERSGHKLRESRVLGYVVDPLYGKLDIVGIGEAGDDHQSFLVKGERFGPDWREESELISVHLSALGRKRAVQIS